MITELCQELRNWFDRDMDKWDGTFSIVNHELVGFSDRLKNGQYYRIIGSVFNDGVHKFGATGAGNTLADETFSGSIWAMAIPPAVIALSSEIDTWKAANEAAVSGPYQSESFGGYSYTLARDSDGNAISWQSAFKGKLKYWRKI